MIAAVPAVLMPMILVTAQAQNLPTPPGLSPPPPATRQLAPPTSLRPPLGVLPPAIGAVGKPDAPGPFIGGKTTPRVGRPPQIKVDSLQGIDPDSVGTLTPDKGGFGPEMWQGTRRPLVERLLPGLPVGTASRSMRDLMRRLLLSAARVPAGEKKENLIAMRVSRLAAMGDIANVVALLRAAPNRSEDPALLRSEAEILFLTNDNGRACPLVASRIRGAGDAFWQKAFVFCQALAGQHAKASLGVALLREQDVQDPVFYGLIDSLAGTGKFEIESLKNPRPLHFAMVRAAKARLPTDISTSDNPAVLRTIATSPNARPELRVDAAERAEGMGALSTDVLRQLYAGITFSEDDLANPLTRADAERSPLSRALLYRKALVESVPAAVAEVLSRAFKLARESGQFGLSARVYGQILSNLPPSQDLIWFASDAVRALLAAGRPAAAKNWFAILRISALFNEASGNIQAALLPLARLTGAEEASTWDAADLSKWLAVQLKPDEDGKTEERERVVARASLLYNLLEGLGDLVPDPQWEELFDGPSQLATVMPRPAIWRAIDVASREVRVGETVLLSLLVLGEAGPTQANPIVIRRVVESLRRVGLEDEARSLAIEAAIVAGI